MAFLTVQAVYDKALMEADKMGSDYFNLPKVLSFFSTATYDFIGEKIKIIEQTQTITEDIKPLVIPAVLNVIADNNEQNCYLAAVPANFHTRLRVNVRYSDQILSRLPTVARHGEHNTDMVDPLRSPKKEYPLIIQMEDYFKIYCGFGNVVSNLILTYIKHPTFGSGPTDVAVNLPVQAVEDIIKRTVTDFMISKGDPRSPIQKQNEQSFRTQG